jgi:hypothetical protein
MAPRETREQALQRQNATLLSAALFQQQQLTKLDDALAMASRCGIREGETLAEFIRRLYEETTADED